MSDNNTEQAETDGGVVSDDEVFSTVEDGKEYRDTVYRETDYENLESAPATQDYPSRGTQDGFKLTELPKVPKVSHIVGPSAIMLGASLGSGETMFWPNLLAQYGWSLYWAFWVGVITQFFINTEIQRWTMATGESIFRGYDRIGRFWPWFFLLAGFFHLGWPGWASGGAKVFAGWTGVVAVESWWIIAVVSMVVIWLSYQAGPLLYNIIERAQLALMFIAIGAALVLTSFRRIGRPTRKLAGRSGQLWITPAK
ncbi:MAG: hypothetical protein J07HR59_00764 [Halorubrum sp. J07HR59]|nr:MAG: hypothetical protein J07HR59_00764 [Halorubrum sp. J07HR59]